MCKSLFLALILSVAALSAAAAQIPPGFEVVDIRSGEEFHQAPRINNCGEVVFYTGTNSDQSEIFWYSNGAVVQITDNSVVDWLPDINDAGIIAWTRGHDLGNREILVLQDGEITSLGEGSGPEVNGLAHLAWQLIDPQTCAFESNILIWDGVSIQEVTEDGLSNQSVSLNDNDEMAWTRTDYCAPGWWISDIMHFSDGVIAELPSVSTQPDSPDISNVGQVAWGAPEGIELWKDGTTLPFTPPGDFDQPGHEPALNDVGDIAFDRKLDSYTYWQLWLYRDGTFYQITDGSSYHAGLEQFTFSRQDIRSA